MLQKSFTVYEVDDDESIRRVLQRLLRSAGNHAVTGSEPVERTHKYF